MTIWPKVPIDPSVGWDMCFACGEDNPIGLKLKVKWDGKTAKTEFIPNKYHQGWGGIVPVSYTHLTLPTSDLV